MTVIPRIVVAASGLLVLTALTSCGEEPDTAEADRPRASAPEGDGSGDATPTASAAPVTPASFDARLEIADGPDWLAAGFGSVWVKRDNGAVVRVSPAGKVEATIDADIFQQPVCQGIGITDTAVWACATGGTLIRIDPATNSFTTADLPKVNEQGRLATSGGLLWVLTGDGDRLEGVSDQGRVTQTIDLGAFCTDTADTATAGMLWVTCPYDGTVLRVDLEAGGVTGQVGDLPGAVRVTVAGDVWVAFDDGLARIDPDSLEVVGTLPLDVSSIRATDDGVWVRGSGDAFLTLVDLESGEVTARLGSPDVTSGGDVVELQGRLWVSAYDDGVLLRVAR
jgi:streptogramin lyase